MTKTKDLKPFTIHSAPHRVISKIHDLEDQLKNHRALDLDPRPIKDQLRDLYKLRKKQKNYKEPKRISKRGL